jgi:hypothetical protein
VLAPAVYSGNRSVLAAAPGPTLRAVDKYFRTELYFGLSKPDGSLVTDEDWAEFLSAEVTPRFPAGFTTLEGRGQFRDNSGTIVRERSRVLIFLYTRETRRESRAKIEEIRNAYIKRFRQESVLRIDFRRSVEVDF